MRGDVQVGLGADHLDVLQQGRKEGPPRGHVPQGREAVVPVGVEVGGQGRADAEPAGQGVPALGPAEDPRNRPERADGARRTCAVRRPRADGQLRELLQRRHGGEVVEEVVILVDRAAEGAPGGVAQLVHDVGEPLLILGGHLIPPVLERVAKHCGEAELERAPGDVREAVLELDDLALLGDLDPTVDAAWGLGDDRPVRRPSAATDRAAAAVEQHQAHAAGLGRRCQILLRPVQPPAGGEQPRVLRRVRVPDHHFLAPALGVELAAIARLGPEALHHGRRGEQVVSGLEQRRDVQRAPPLVPHEADETRLPGEDHHGQQVGGAGGHGDHAGADCLGATLLVDLPDDFEQLHHLECVGAQVHVPRQQGAPRVELVEEQALLLVWRQRVPGAVAVRGDHAASDEQFRHDTGVAAGVLAYVQGGEVKAEHPDAVYERLHDGVRRGVGPVGA